MAWNYPGYICAWSKLLCGMETEKGFYSADINVSWETVCDGLENQIRVLAGLTHLGFEIWSKFLYLSMLWGIFRD